MTRRFTRGLRSAMLPILLTGLGAGFPTAFALGQDLAPGDRPRLARTLIEVRTRRERARRDDTETLARLEAVVRACLHEDGPKWLQPLADYELGRLRLRFGFTEPGLRLIRRAIDAGLDDGAGALADLDALLPADHAMRARLMAVQKRSDADAEDRREMSWLRMAGVTELQEHVAGAEARARRTDSTPSRHPGPSIPVRRTRSKTCQAERRLLRLARAAMQAELTAGDERRAALAALARASVMTAPKLTAEDREARLAELDARAVADAGRARRIMETTLLKRTRAKRKALGIDATKNPLGAVSPGDFAEYRQTMSVVGEVVAAVRFRETVQGFEGAGTSRRIVILQTVQRLAVEGEQAKPGPVQTETRTLTLAPTFKGQLTAGLAKDGAVSGMRWEETDVVLQQDGPPRVLRRIEARFVWARRGDPESWTLVGLRDLNLPGMGWRRLTLENSGLTVVRELTKMRGIPIDAESGDSADANSSRR